VFVSPLFSHWVPVVVVYVWWENSVGTTVGGGFGAGRDVQLIHFLGQRLGFRLPMGLPPSRTLSRKIDMAISTPAEVLAHLAYFHGSTHFRPEQVKLPGMTPADIEAALQILQRHGYAAQTMTSQGKRWWITGAGVEKGLNLEQGDRAASSPTRGPGSAPGATHPWSRPMPTEPDPVTAARYTVSVWQLHWASFRYHAASMFPEKYVTPQSALVVRTWEEAKIILDELSRRRQVGLLTTLGGKSSAGRPVENLCVIHPWVPGQVQEFLGDAFVLEITLAADRSNLEDLAFQVHRKFDFVADLLKELTERYLLGSRIMGGQFRDQGWAAIPGFREAHGKVGRLTSPPPSEF